MKTKVKISTPSMRREGHERKLVSELYTVGHKAPPSRRGARPAGWVDGRWWEVSGAGKGRRVVALPFLHRVPRALSFGQSMVAVPLMMAHERLAKRWRHGDGG